MQKGEEILVLPFPTGVRGPSDNLATSDSVILSETKDLISTESFTVRFFGCRLGMTFVGQALTGVCCAVVGSIIMITCFPLPSAGVLFIPVYKTGYSSFVLHK